LRVVVCFKVTREVEHLTPAELEALCEGGDDLSSTRKMIDTHDEASLEIALRLRESAATQGEEVRLTALTAGDCESRFLKGLFALEYDTIIHIPCAEEVTFRPEHVAAAICSYVDAGAKFDALLTGQQASIGENAATPYLIAERLGIPCISNVIDVEYCRGKLRATAQIDAGVRSALINVPAVYAVGNALHPYLRMATLRKMLAAAGRVATRFEAGDCSPRMGEARLNELRFTKSEKKCRFIEGDNIEEKIAALWEKYIKPAGAP
jgi:electron transfer flavoprotein beta subunit